MRRMVSSLFGDIPFERIVEGLGSGEYVRRGQYTDRDTQIARGANADGVYSASGQLTRPGRWELVLERGGVREVLAFIVQE
jgi:hypothetical protein